MSARLSTCLACKHSGTYASFAAARDGYGMACPECASRGPFTTRENDREETEAQTGNDQHGRDAPEALPAAAEGINGVAAAPIQRSVPADAAADGSPGNGDREPRPADRKQVKSAACADTQEPSKGDENMAAKRVTAEDGEQGTLIETDHPEGKNIKRMARAYKNYQRERMEVLDKEVELKGKILETMHKAKLTEFRCAEMVVTIKPADEKVKVKFTEDADGRRWG